MLEMGATHIPVSGVQFALKRDWTCWGWPPMMSSTFKFSACTTLAGTKTVEHPVKI